MKLKRNFGIETPWNIIRENLNKQGSSHPYVEYGGRCNCIVCNYIIIITIDSTKTISVHHIVGGDLRSNFSYYSMGYVNPPSVTIRHVTAESSSLLLQAV